MEGDGIEYLSLDNDITFTSEDSGDTYSTAWVGPKDGILGIDTDNSGSINLDKEYVFTEWSEDAKTDMEALLEVFDTNNSGSLDPADLEWGDFGVWIDSDTDGFSDPGEFISLDDLGIVEISLEYESTQDKTWSPYEDVLIHGETEVIFNDGSTVTAQDTEFKIENMINEAQEESFSSLIEQLIAIQNNTSSIQNQESLDEANEMNDEETIEENTSWENLLKTIIKESQMEERDDIKNEEGEAERNYPESENTEQSLSDINANEVIDDLSTSEEEIDENYV